MSRRVRMLLSFWPDPGTDNTSKDRAACALRIFGHKEDVVVNGRPDYILLAEATRTLPVDTDDEVHAYMAKRLEQFDAIMSGKRAVFPELWQMPILWDVDKQTINASRCSNCKNIVFDVHDQLDVSHNKWATCEECSIARWACT